MPTGVEYRRKIIRLEQALRWWHDIDNRLRNASSADAQWTTLPRMHVQAADDLHAAYEAVRDAIMEELEQQWGGGVRSGS